MSKYEELRKIDVSAKIEKKNNLSYLSWAWAVDVLLQQDASATWEYQEPKKFGETVMVFCSVTAFNKTMTAQLPVMDFRNKAIPNPDAFAVNTAMQRCLAKAIALHGLGLYIYAGEDLPEDDNGQAVSKAVPKKAKQLIDDTRLNAAIQKIMTGSYTIIKLKENFDLTAEQTKLVNDMCGE